MIDPRIEKAAIELAYISAPSLFFPRLDKITDAHKRQWWDALPQITRDGYLYRASVVIETAYPEMADAE